MGYLGALLTGLTFDCILSEEYLADGEGIRP